jgi:hypothetical protein
VTILLEEIEPIIEIDTVKLEIRFVLSLSICIYKVTFDNISITQYISLLSVLLVEETRSEVDKEIHGPSLSHRYIL